MIEEVRVAQDWLDRYWAMMRGEVEYRSWAPQSFWDAQHPGMAEYDSWGKVSSISPQEER